MGNQKEQPVRHLLAVENSLFFNTETQQEEYELILNVSQDVIDWLENHDVEFLGDRSKIYICNKIRYVYLGVNLEIPSIPMNYLTGEA